MIIIGKCSKCIKRILFILIYQVQIMDLPLLDKFLDILYRNNGELKDDPDGCSDLFRLLLD
jgi:hypothetical protein